MPPISETMRRPFATGYRILRPIATGGMAEVYLADAECLDGSRARVAIKRVLPQLTEDRELMRMLADEASVGMRLDHPNLVKVLEYRPDGPTPFLVLEFVEGSDLLRVGQALASRGARFSIAEAVEITIQICRGLAAAHGLNDEDGKPLGLVHRDVTPPNILVSQEGRARLCDFGLAKASSQAEQTAPGVIKGKFGYLSPEGAFGASVDPRADLFSLGVVLWEMLGMQRLFRGEHDYDTVQLVQQAEIPRLNPHNPDVDAVLQEIVERALARDAANRFQTAQDFERALLAYQDWQDLSGDLTTLVHSAESRATLPQAPRARSGAA